MRFQLKALIQWLVSALPYTHKLNSFLRKKGTKELISEEHYNEKLNLARSYLALFREYSESEKPYRILDFGAGFDLIIPIFLSDFCDKVIAYDIQKNADKELISTAIEKIKRVTISPNKMWPFLAENLGVDYRTSRSLRSIEFSKKLDLILSTVVFEYLSEGAIEETLSVFSSSLSHKGLVILKINYRDHWAHSDRNISDYNFLKYSQKEWKRYCPPQCSQNRLRNSDYLRLIKAAGFQIKLQETTTGSLHELNGIEIHSDFKHYETEDLLIKDALFVLLPTSD